LIIASLYFPFDNLSIHIAIQENEGHYVYGKYYKEINSMAFLKLFRTEKSVKKRRTMGGTYHYEMECKSRLNNPPPPTFLQALCEFML
jgi:hypothetical protein